MSATGRLPSSARCLGFALALVLTPVGGVATRWGTQERVFEIVDDWVVSLSRDLITDHAEGFAGLDPGLIEPTPHLLIAVSCMTGDSAPTVQLEYTGRAMPNYDDQNREMIPGHVRFDRDTAEPVVWKRMPPVFFDADDPSTVENRDAIFAFPGDAIGTTRKLMAHGQVVVELGSNRRYVEAASLRGSSETISMLLDACGIDIP